MKKTRWIGGLCILSMVFFMAGAVTVHAIDLMDGKVVIHGKASEQLNMRAGKTSPGQLYDYSIFNFRTSLKLEAMWHIQKCPDYELNFYSVWKQFYDYADKIDSGFDDYVRRMSGHKGITELRSYETFLDINRELYGEYTTPLFQVRIGKQIVSWGETSFERVCDIVNPVDARGLLNPGYPDFAELKRGLFMLRFYLTPPDMPGNLTFEALVIPEFEPNRGWPAGYHLTHPKAFNALKDPNEIFLADYRDAPSSWADPALGFRIRGFTWGFDWTFQFLHQRNPQGIVKTGKALQAQLPALLGPELVGRTQNVKTFMHQNSIGFTFNRPINVKIPIIPCTNLAMSGNVLKWESIVEFSKAADRIVGTNVEVIQKNRYAGVLGWDTKIFIPGLTPWNRNKHLSSSTQFIVEGIPGKTREDQYYPYNTYAPNKQHYFTITQSLDYGFWNDRILLGFYGVEMLTPNKNYYTLMTAFKPTFSWTYMIRYLNYLHTTPATQRLDMVTFDITYEF